MTDEMTEQPVAGRILLVDDDQIVLESLGSLLQEAGHEVASVRTAEEAMACLRGSRFDVVITEVATAREGGYEVLRFVQRHSPDVAVILLAGYGTIESAVEAIRQGAYHYLTKPVNEDEVRVAVARAIRQRRLVEENRRLRAQLGGGNGPASVVGQDVRMSRVFELIDAVADSRSTVLITGESGTGKSMIARAIHAHSPRNEGAFVEVACGALPEGLLESELFGHVKGAFTGAVEDKPGKFAAADGGTIFLDEIATASPQLQVKLLRVLQERQFEPVGSNRTVTVDTRVILATNHDLWSEVQAGRFRSDLYYRVNVVNIELPPLRDRRGDIALLAEHFLARALQHSRKQILGFTSEALQRMTRYDWPGNVRELENCVERAVLLCRSPYIELQDLPPALADMDLPGGVNLAAAAGQTLEAALAGAERQIILAALKANHGNRQATARQLGINRVTLYKKMHRLGLGGQ